MQGKEGAGYRCARVFLRACGMHVKCRVSEDGAWMLWEIVRACVRVYAFVHVCVRPFVRLCVRARALSNAYLLCFLDCCVFISM